MNRQMILEEIFAGVNRATQHQSQQPRHNPNQQRAQQSQRLNTMR